MLQIAFFANLLILFLLSQAIMKSIFLAAIGGDLPKLVRLSNAFCMVDGANPFRLEPMKATLPSSKATSTAGARRSSTFLYRSRFIGCENTFNTTEEMGE